MKYASKADAENIRSISITGTIPIKANLNQDNTGIKSTKNMIYRIYQILKIFFKETHHSSHRHATL